MATPSEASSPPGRPGGRQPPQRAAEGGTRSLGQSASAAGGADRSPLAPAPPPAFRWSPAFPHRLAASGAGADDGAGEGGDGGNGETTETRSLYPNCDVSIWLRSCSQEVLSPLEGITTGTIPKWLNGSLLRNGPGNLKVGNMTFDHLFDCSALLHRFAIADGRATYQSRFLQTQTLKRNMAAQRIVVTEFGTRALPDPCQSIFQRVTAFFTPGENYSDNAMISVYPFGDEYYTFTESPVIHRIDPSTLDTLDRVNVSRHVNIVNHSSHPHVMADGTVYNMGLTVGPAGPAYAIVKFPPTKTQECSGETASMFEQATIVGKVPARWRFHPSYMHTFGFTPNYFVIVEQPLSVSVPAMLMNQVTNEPMASSFRWYDKKQTIIYLLCRKSGKVAHKFRAEAFFYLHIINCFEKDEHVIVDICCYRDPSMLDCMYIESLKGLHCNPDYARMFRSRPLRFALPLRAQSPQTSPVRPELLCALGCETPRLHAELCAGRPYRFFYAISSDVDLDNPGTLIKVDTFTRTAKTWCEANVYPSEPIFVPAPDATAEDDGVVISALLWGRGDEDRVALLVLDAVSWTELGRTEFATPGPVPKCLHGWFASGK